MAGVVSALLALRAGKLALAALCRSIAAASPVW